MKSLRDIFKRLPQSGEHRHLLRNFNFAPSIDGKAKSVRVLAEALGFDVVRTPLPRRMAGRLVQDAFAPNGYRIEVNSEQSVTAQRFAVLHEIGHYYLHADHTDPLGAVAYLDRSESMFYADPKEEREANQFAATLLFGDGALEAARSLHGNDVPKLAHYFGVSERTIEIAMKQY
ncbi:hypothetical protein BMG03_14245 [Thioclava nitratireducens]|uniref:IrrE N-terminal-like domain-containing protein n=1 Tax=Thioclava nitratireducens TaxID=1915078 RepID=A0ABM6IJC0_9RHOB|nr:ImmA/IrrE family metallo-endopeptidase [Thioclava nitratireducens]AQS48822.1 hypothetical protein BMG03_14245 [Thioclava nitratireducens]